MSITESFLLNIEDLKPFVKDRGYGTYFDEKKESKEYKN